jgi:hypothetical protein
MILRSIRLFILLTCLLIVGVARAQTPTERLSTLEEWKSSHTIESSRRIDQLTDIDRRVGSFQYEINGRLASLESNQKTTLWLLGGLLISSLSGLIQDWLRRGKRNAA